MERLSNEQKFSVLRAQAGDRDAFEAVLRIVQGPLYGYLRTLTGNREIAEDLFQDVMLLIYRKISWLRDPALLLPWSFRIATRHATKKMRSVRASREEPLGEWEGSVPAAGIVKLLRDEAVNALQDVSPSSRAVLTLHYLEDLPLAEVGAILDLPSGTVKSRLAYGLAQLRKLLNGR